jgi:hypothetical protein
MLDSSYMSRIRHVCIVQSYLQWPEEARKTARRSSENCPKKLGKLPKEMVKRVWTKARRALQRRRDNILDDSDAGVLGKIGLP